MTNKRTWTSDEKRLVGARTGWKCEMCGGQLNAAFEVDHKTPLELGGSNDLETNARALCSCCHALKTQNERVQRIKRARERLAELQKDLPEPPEKRRVWKSTEDVILDETNPFRRFVYMRGV